MQQHNPVTPASHAAWKRWSLLAVTSLCLMASMHVSLGRYDEGARRESSAEPSKDRSYLRANNSTWQAECSTCHMAYPPGLLPASTWRTMLQQLGDHFGSDASLDEASLKAILPFLEAHAAPEAQPVKEPQNTPLRITETAWFKHEHDEISALTWKNPKVKSASNCIACHSQAEQGSFDEDSVTIPR